MCGYAYFSTRNWFYVHTLCYLEMTEEAISRPVAGVVGVRVWPTLCASHRRVTVVRAVRLDRLAS